mgnify:CR=1 FL=1
MCVLVTQLCPTPCNPMDSSPPGSSVHGILQERILVVDSYSLLQGIFPTHGSNPGLLHSKQILYRLGHQGSPTVYYWIKFPISERIWEILLYLLIWRENQSKTLITCLCGSSKGKGWCTRWRRIGHVWAAKQARWCVQSLGTGRWSPQTRTHSGTYQRRLWAKYLLFQSQA